MIDAAIALVTRQLNESLKRQFVVGDEMATMCNLLEQDGTVTTQSMNKLVVFLVGVEREAVPGGQGGGGPAHLRANVHHAPVHLNLLIMFAANFGGANYPEALKFLSSTISFFQSHPVFQHSDSPELDSRVERLTMEIENLSIADLSNLWGILSGKYLPSVLYRMRLVTIDARQVRAQVPRVVQPEVSAGARAS